MKLLAKVFSTFFGAGYFPLAPGTFASLLAALLYKSYLHRLDGKFYSSLIVIVFLGGAVSAGAFSRQVGQKDPRKVVIDEVCGQWIAYVLAPSTWTVTAIGFILFRVFDVLKPFPIRNSEKLPRGWGIMMDDVLAGIYSALLLQLYMKLR